MAEIPSGLQAFEAKVSQVTNTYAMPGGRQAELHSAHSISEQGPQDAFIEIMWKLENNSNEEIRLSRASSEFCSHWTHASISRAATFK